MAIKVLAVDDEKDIMEGLRISPSEDRPVNP